MKVVDIHPEELIDKLAEGSLTPAERERLGAHLELCASCRFEIALRSDLASDAPAFEQRPQLAVTGAARRPGLADAPVEPPAPQALRSLRPRARHRWPLMMFAAAFVLCAGGAMAAVITGAIGVHWRPSSAQPKSAEASVRQARPALKPKRPAATPASSPPSALSAVPVATVTSQAIAVPASGVVASAPAALPVRSRSLGAAPDKERAPALGAFATGGAVPAAPSIAEPPGPRVNPAAALFADANRARRDGNVDRAVGLYRALQSRYPSSSESELSRALLAQLLLDRGNPEAALADFDCYLADDAPVLSAEAWVGRARALEQLGKPTQAAAAWRQVQSRFPGSVHARLAATRLAALGMR